MANSSSASTVVTRTVTALGILDAALGRLKGGEVAAEGNENDEETQQTVGRNTGKEQFGIPWR